MDEEVISFIKGTVGSVWALELLLFVRAHPERAWSAAELARELRSNERLAEGALGAFEAAGLVAPAADGCRYAPESAEIDAIAGRLAEAYRERPVAVVNAIVARRAGGLRGARAAKET